jgi:hypothetical protein
MNIFNQLSKFTKAVLIAGLVLVMYGYLCRLIALYFFWESKTIGWTLLCIGIIGFLYDRIKINKTGEKKTLIEKIGIGIIAFSLLVQCMLLAIILFSEAYSAAKLYLIKDTHLKKEIGNIRGFGLIPIGSIEVITDSIGEYGTATINLTVKGDPKFKDVTIYLAKYADRPDWEVQEIE